MRRTAALARYLAPAEFSLRGRSSYAFAVSPCVPTDFTSIQRKPLDKLVLRPQQQRRRSRCLAGRLVSTPTLARASLALAGGPTTIAAPNCNGQHTLELY